jgi:nicotinate dehydrogenase subunit B
VAVQRAEGEALQSFWSRTFSRREFLKGGGAMVVGFSLAGPLLSLIDAGTAEAANAQVSVPADVTKTPAVDAWLAIQANGDIVIYQSKVEIGAGETTAIAQIAADELYVPLSRIIMHRVDTSVTPWDAGTFGSQSVQGGGASVRLAAATARQALLAMAAQKFNTTIDKLTIRDGVIYGPGGKVSYAELVGGKKIGLQIDPQAPLRDPKTYAVVGQPIPRVDLPQKLTGANGPYQYVVNVRVPGMLHARILRPPAFGATISSMDTSAIEKMPGVVAVIPLTFGPGMQGWNAVWQMPQGQCVAVLAKTEGQAIAALSALEKVVKWQGGGGLPSLQSTEGTADYMVSLSPVRTATEGAVVGDAASAIAQAPLRLSARYATPYQTNGPIGPGCAVADVKPNGATVWSGSQVPFSVQQAVAAATGLPPEKVRVLQYDASGSYGRGNLDDAAVEAAILSQKVGRPVRVQWMRQEEFVWSTCRTPLVFQLQGGVDTQGNLLGWQSEVWSDTHIVNTGALFGATYGGGVLPPYSGAHSTTVHYVRSALRKGAMRGLGSWATVFAHEGFIDELAFLAGQDPVEFRLKNLNDPRAVAVIQEAAKLAGWKPHTRPRANGTGQGISFLFDQRGTYVAEIATVSVDRSSGRVQVKSVAVAHDCGLIINPDGLRNQIEGGVIQGTSWTLKEMLRFNASTVTSRDWLTYPILRFSEVPDVQISLINRPDQPASGAGEPASMAIGAAIGNAFFDATGVRMRATPFTPDRVKLALG